MPITDYGNHHRPVLDSIAGKTAQLADLRVNHNGHPITATDEALAEALDQVAGDTLATLDQGEDTTAPARNQPRPDPSQGAGRGSFTHDPTNVHESIAAKSVEVLGHGHRQLPR